MEIRRSPGKAGACGELGAIRLGVGSRRTRAVVGRLQHDVRDGVELAGSRCTASAYVEYGLWSPDVGRSVCGHVEREHAPCSVVRALIWLALVV